MSFFGLGQKQLTVDIAYNKPTLTCVVKSDANERESLPLITSGDSIEGVLHVSPGKRRRECANNSFPFCSP